MKVAIFGAGYVGLVTGSCIADMGNDVTCVDINDDRVAQLNRGEVPIYEPGLSEMIKRNAVAGRLRFTTDSKEPVRQADVIFLAVGTPQDETGAADLTALWKVADQIAPHLQRHTVVVTKSTVPVGTNARLTSRLRELTGHDCHVASNPEFLKEGAAIEDFAKPDRVVVGVRKPEVADVLHRLYEPFLRTDKPFLVMSPESAELTKYVANALLATKISFINQMANVCERYKGDINDVRRGIGHDRRIGFSFLFPGVGYGGSCFPKDVRAMINTFREVDIDPLILEAVDAVNEIQKNVIVEKIEKHFDGQSPGKTVAIWGLSFKPKTDDIREAPSLVLIDRLLRLKANVVVYDPVAIENVRSVYGDKLAYVTQPMDALDGAHALAIMTEWAEFRTPNFSLIKSKMASPAIFDGRNLYDPGQMKVEGFEYHSIGRPTVMR